MSKASKANEDDPLDRYRSMRDFDKTAEPAGAKAGRAKKAAKAGGRAKKAAEASTDSALLPAGQFVVQRHRARRLHYDLRLELNGVLVSWAVPKGPPQDPSARVLAVKVEDHPLEYADFEGVIPSGEYGGGDVIVWDRGTWTPARPDDPAAAIAAGELHFDLAGEKLRGRFLLIRRDRGGSGKEQWLLLHKKDEFAEPGWNPEEHPESVKTGRTNDDVRAARDAVWHSDRTDGPPEAPAEKAPAQKAPAQKAPAQKAPAEKRPARPTFEAPTAEELDALDHLGKAGTWDLQGHELKLTNLDKVLFPARPDGQGPFTKRDLVRYHAQIAPVMLPYLVDRPVNLHRFPNGVDKPGFWHKAVPSHAPPWLQRWRYDDARPGETEWYFVVDSPPALAWMANYGAVELHPWTSRRADPHQPAWAYIDIDPGTTTTFDDIVLLATLFHTALDHLSVLGLPKVTGQRGIQIWIPIAAGYSFDETRAWIEALSRAVGATVPELVSWKWHKSDREGLARLDFTQNAINRTLVAPYSARAAAGAPVSVPIAWAELDDPDLRPDRWTIATVLDRVTAAGDPFAELLDVDQRLPAL